MDSDHSGYDSDSSNDEYGYKRDALTSSGAPEDDGTVLCTCGCGERVIPRRKYRHLKKLRDSGISSDSGAGIIDANTGNEIDEGQGVGTHDEEEIPGKDLPMHYTSEDEEIQAPSSRGSWYHVGTPIPSLPHTPLQLSEDDVSSDDEYGYSNVNAEDYREYDRWFSEDRDVELNEMIAETLTEEELDSIKMMAIRQFGHISIRNYERIRYSFRNKVFLLTLQRLGTRIAALSGVKPDNYDCCVNVCHAFTGQFAEETTCSTCDQPRYDELNRPRQTYQYIPTIARFQAMFNNPSFVQALEYRHTYPQHEGRMDDFFDSELYKKLCQQNIIIDGKDTGVTFFSGKYDIATTILTDGVQIFHQETATCWPVMLQILNLPPHDRSQLRNIIPLCVIPGPNQPKDFNSFLEPFVEESIRFSRGIKTFNVVTRRDFLLRHHPVLVAGDMQAIKHLEEMKGVNAKVPCRGCESVGIYSAERRTYYIPLAAPLSSDRPAASTSSYDPLALPLRTEARMATQLDKMDRAATSREYEELAKRYGISGHSILDRIPSIKRPTSYPYEFLHLFLLNHVPDLLTLWIGGNPGIPDAGCENYLISREDWAAIGKETEAATNLLPTAFIRPLPNIQTRQRVFCGESWSFWTLYVGPIVLRGRLPKKYYDHFLGLVSIIKCLLEFENSTERIERLREEIAEYVERYEEYYYQYNYNRVCVCKLVVHALLHVADDVLRCGPVWAYWSFIVERYCREVTACARQRTVPFSTIDKFVLQAAQLSTVAMRYQEIRKALLFGKADAPVDTSRMERIYPDYPHAILRSPLLPGFLLQPNVRRRVVAYLRTNNPGRTFQEWMEYLPERCERWGKLRIVDGGDRIRSACATNSLSVYGKRDSSFIRFTFWKDKNENRRNLPVELVPETGYGRLDFILAITLPPNPRFNIDAPKLHVLAHITEAKGAEGDATTKLVSYTQLGRSFVLDITAVENVVGRVETKGVRPGGEWVIVDRSQGLCRTVFHSEEPEFEGEGD